MKNSASKTAIVTGASRGIGQAIAIKLAGKGYNVIVNYLSNKAEAEQVAAQVKQAGGQAIAVEGDVSKLAEFAYLFDVAEQTYGVVDVLVNNAGISKLSPIVDFTDEMFDQLFNINVRGTLNGLKLAATRLNHGGSIINFSSTAVATATPGMGLYVGSKAAIEAISRVFVKELKGKGIRVNTVAPGLIKSAMFFEGKSPEQISNFEKISPLQRLGEAEEIAGVIAYLAGDEAGWVNGQLIRVNGGAI